MGTWARGLNLKNSSDTTVLGGVGLYGSDTTALRMYLGFGDEPWNQGLQVTSDEVKFNGKNLGFSEHHHNNNYIGYKMDGQYPGFSINGDDNWFIRVPQMGILPHSGGDSRIGLPNNTFRSAYVDNIYTDELDSKLIKENGESLSSKYALTRHSHSKVPANPEAIEDRHLDDIKGPGFYLQADYSKPTTTKGYPVNYCGTLVVTMGKVMMQTYYCDVMCETYQRSFITPPTSAPYWSKWAKLYTSENKPSASEIGAAESKHYHFGSFNSPSILTNEDLNTIFLLGAHYQGDPADASLARNYPVNKAGTLQVILGDMPMQKYVVRDDNLTEYSRTYAIDQEGRPFWTAWQRTYSSGNKPTPAEIGAAVTTHTHTASEVSALSIPRALGAAIDMNTVTTPGMYYCASNAYAEKYTNCPTNMAFSLLVEKHAGVKQTLTTYTVTSANIKTYSRNFYSSSWSPWYRVFTTNDKPTVTEIGAAPAAHNHDSNYYTKSVIDTSINSITPPKNIARNNLGDPTILEAAIIDSQASNKIWFLEPSKLLLEISDDGVTYTVDDKVTETVKKTLVAGRSGANYNFSKGKYLRITIDATGYVFLNWLYLYMSTNGDGASIQIEKRMLGTDTWNVHVPYTNKVSNWPGHVFIPHSSIAFATGTDKTKFDKVRIVIKADATSNPTYQTMTLYGIEWWGGYPTDKRTIFDWDINKNVKFPAELYVNSTSKVYHQDYKPTADDVGAVPNIGGTLNGTLRVNGNIDINSRIRSALTGTTILRDYGNGNVTLSATKNPTTGVAGALYLGYTVGDEYVTSHVRLEQRLSWKNTRDIVNANGYVPWAALADVPEYLPLTGGYINNGASDGLFGVHNNNTRLRLIAHTSGVGYIQCGKGTTNHQGDLIISGYNAQALNSLNISANSAMINGSKIYHENFKPTAEELGITTLIADAKRSTQDDYQELNKRILILEETVEKLLETI